MALGNTRWARFTQSAITRIILPKHSPKYLHQLWSILLSNLFRLRYYLRRSGEKQTVVLLEPILISHKVYKRYYWYSSETCGAPKAQGTFCKDIELHKLERIHKPQRLLAELQYLENRPQQELADDIYGLWQGSIKGIALKHLQKGQIIASDGIWLVRERSFYILIPGSVGFNHKRNLRLNNDSLVQLIERSTGKTFRGTMAVLEQWNSANTSTLFCRLSLDQPYLISLKQTLPHNRSLYSLTFIENNITDIDIFLFAPVSHIENSKDLQTFLRLELDRRNISIPEQTHRLETLATDFWGWGGAIELKGKQPNESHLFIPPEQGASPNNNLPSLSFGTCNNWVSIGAWQIKYLLLQKYVTDMYRQARFFGGVPIETLRTQTGATIPLALLQSLLDYLCNKLPDIIQFDSQEENTLQGSCEKVEDYLLAKESMYPTDSIHIPSYTPSNISPQGRKMLQDLIATGKTGTSWAPKPPEVLQALLRSGWALQVDSRYYARACCHDISKPQSQVQKTPSDLAAVLATYKKKNLQRLNTANKNLPKIIKNRDASPIPISNKPSRTPLNTTSQPRQHKQRPRYSHTQFSPNQDKTYQDKTYKKTERKYTASKRESPKRPRRYEERNHRPNEDYHKEKRQKAPFKAQYQPKGHAKQKNRPYDPNHSNFHKSNNRKNHRIRPFESIEKSKTQRPYTHKTARKPTRPRAEVRPNKLKSETNYNRRGRKYSTSSKTKKNPSRK